MRPATDLPPQVGGLSIRKLVVSRTITLLTDDLDGTELQSGAGEASEFARDRTTYEVDLSIKNAKGAAPGRQPISPLHLAHQQYVTQLPGPRPRADQNNS
jgi:hypothetical protein